jgi:hypothetical protein
MAVSINYDMDQGTDFSFTLVAKNDDGTPKDVKYYYSVFSQMRKYYTSSTSITLTATKIDGEIGGITVSMTASQTKEIKPGVYFYDVILVASPTNPTEPNFTRRLQQGMITVYPDVTR